MSRIIAFLVLVICSGIFAQTGGDILNEAPFYEIPDEITFEEYRDANRRISVGLMLLSVPIPGTMHFYADEDFEAWMCVGTAGLGLISMAAGALLADEEQWPESDYQIVTIDGNRYEKIPIQMTGEEIKYELKQQIKESELSAGGAVLLGLGGILIAGEILYDWIDGINTIEYKRDAVRYKYGIGEYNTSIKPISRGDGRYGIAVNVE